MLTAEAQNEIDYDTVELRTGRLYKIRLSAGRVLDEQDVIVTIVKCYCRSHDVLTTAEAEVQRRPAFVFPDAFFKNLEALIGRELEGLVYFDTGGRRARFYLDLKEHAGFQFNACDSDLHSPWYDDSVLKE